MFRYISQYVSIYDLYLQTKPVYYLLCRELYLLPIPNARWETISIDFIIELPESTVFDVVIMIVDSIFKRAYFILTHTMVIAESTTILFLYYV